MVLRYAWYKMFQNFSDPLKIGERFNISKHVAMDIKSKALPRLSIKIGIITISGLRNYNF